MQANGYEIKRIEFDGVEYGVEKREAKVGEKILIVDANYSFGKYDNGDVLEVTDKDFAGIMCDSVRTYADEPNPGGFIANDEYVVLVPQASTKAPAEPPQTPKLDALDLISNLSLEVAKLQRKVADLTERTDSNTGDLRTIAEEAQKTAYELAGASERIEMLTDDIVTLDERTHPKQLAETVAKQFAKEVRKHGRSY